MRVGEVEAWRDAIAIAMAIARVGRSGAAPSSELRLKAKSGSVVGRAWKEERGEERGCRCRYMRLLQCDPFHPDKLSTFASTMSCPTHHVVAPSRRLQRSTKAFAHRADMEEIEGEVKRRAWTAMRPYGAVEGTGVKGMLSDNSNSLQASSVDLRLAALVRRGMVLRYHTPPLKKGGM